MSARRGRTPPRFPRLVAGALVLALGGGAAAQDVQPERGAFVEVVPARTWCYPGELLPVTLRVGTDAVYFPAHAIQRFHRQLDVPLRVVFPPWDALTQRHEPSDAGARRDTLVVNDGVVRATRGTPDLRDGRSFRVHELTRWFLADRPGPVVWSAPELRFGHAERFEEDFVNGRTAVDPRDVTLLGPAVRIEVRPLPEEGRPAGFGGAIGNFRFETGASTERVRTGDTFTLTLRISGRGNLTRFSAPPLADDTVVHALGVRDDRAEPVRTIVYDVLARGPGAAPPFRMHVFDPDEGVYRCVTSEAPGVTVDAAPGAEAETGAAAGSEESGGGRAALVAALLVGGLAVLVLWWRRRAPPDLRDPRVVRHEEARAAYVARREASPADALAAFLAAHLATTPAAVIGPDLAARLGGAGLDGDVARRAAARLETLVAARYGGAPVTPNDLVELDRLVDEVEAGFRRA